MSRFLDQVQDASRDHSRCRDDWGDSSRPFRVLTVTNNKGGIGKTTLAANLAVYIRALHEDLPILVIGLDDQDTLDRYFSLGPPPKATVLTGIRAGNFAGTLCDGQYGIHYVPSCDDVTPAKRLMHQPFDLQTILTRTGWRGLVILDTKSDFEILTRNAVAAGDLVLVVVKDLASLRQAEKVFRLLRDYGRRPTSARVVLSMVDRRIKYRETETADVLALLISEIRRRGYPLLESFLSHSPKVASLETNPSGNLLPVLVGAPRSMIHQQFRQIAHDVLKLLDTLGLPQI